jgi:hypothetical protein
LRISNTLFEKIVQFNDGADQKFLLRRINSFSISAPYSYGTACGRPQPSALPAQADADHAPVVPAPLLFQVSLPLELIFTMTVTEGRAT